MSDFLLDPPAAPENPPGKDALAYRMDTHVSALQRMLGSLRHAADNDSALGPLRKLDPQARNDPALALIDAWAAVVGVMTFYQERIANEGFLQTARERRSIREMARTVGCQPRPGVSASVFLAYTLEKGHDVEIPAGTRAQSVPGPGEVAQTFETSVPLAARGAWNVVRPLTTRPQSHAPSDPEPAPMEVKLPVPALRPGFPLLTWSDQGSCVRPMLSVEQVPQSSKAILYLGRVKQSNPIERPKPHISLVKTLENDLKALLQKLGIVKDQTVTSDHIRHAKVIHPNQAADIDAARAAAAAPTSGKAYAFRIMAGLFGCNATKFKRPKDVHSVPSDAHDLVDADKYAEKFATEKRLYLDSVYEIPAGSWVLIESPSRVLVAIVASTSIAHRSDYELAARITVLKLEWPGNPPTPGDLFGAVDDKHLDHLREVVVYAGSEPMELADAPTDPVTGKSITIDGDCPEMEPGRPLLIKGRKVQGAMAVEMSTVDRVDCGSQVVLHLKKPLDDTYVPGSVEIYGNVVEATHGETRNETLGSGNANLAHQVFTLKQGPLTHVHAPTFTGECSALGIRVDGVRWHKSDDLIDLSPDARHYTLDTDELGNARVRFGNGIHGARLPTGIQNVTAKYRIGLGTAGNVPAGRISLAIDRPLGVKDVINLLQATGGADAEGRESTRQNVWRSTTVFDRLIGPTDYERFAQAFGGVGKAVANWLNTTRDGSSMRRLCLTVAGTTPVPLDLKSDLLQNLDKQFRRIGDPRILTDLADHRTVPLRFGAAVRIDPDYLWKDVQARIRADLLNVFGYSSRDFGQGVALSEIVARVSRCAGVMAVKPLLLAVAGRDEPPGKLPPRVDPRPMSTNEEGKLLGAEVVCFSADLPETLTLDPWAIPPGEESR